MGHPPRSSSTVLAKFLHLESIPADSRDWQVRVTNATTLAATLSEQRAQATLFRTLATLRTDIKLFDDIDQLRWAGPRPEFEPLAARLDAAKTQRRSKDPR